MFFNVLLFTCSFTLFEYLRHCLNKKCSRPTSWVKYPSITMDTSYLAHEMCYMVWCKGLVLVLSCHIFIKSSKEVTKNIVTFRGVFVYIWEYILFNEEKNPLIFLRPNGRNTLTFQYFSLEEGQFCSSIKAIMKHRS